MPSVTHEAPIELIRQHPDLAVQLLQAMSDVDLPSEIAVSLGPTDLSEVVPMKFLADAVVIVADKATGEPALVIIIEPQGPGRPDQGVLLAGLPHRRPQAPPLPTGVPAGDLPGPR